MLAKGWFWPLFILFAFLLFHQFFYGKHFLHTLYLSGVDRSDPILMGLISERDQLQNTLLGDCQGSQLIEFRDGFTGPLAPHGDNQSSSPQTSSSPTSSSASNSDNSIVPSENRMTSDRLVQLLEKSTVRVVTKGGSGSGFFISQDTIITNAHVIQDQADKGIYITSKNLGVTPIPVDLVIATINTAILKKDFAVLKIRSPMNNILFLPIGADPTALEPVVAAGYPGSVVQTDQSEMTPSVIFSQGAVRVVQAQSDGPSLIAHTANISPGSSGGPLVNRCGHLVGVNTFIMGPEDKFDSRELFSLASSSLKQYLTSSHIAFNNSALCSNN